MLEPPRGYRALAWIGLVANILSIPLGVLAVVGDPHWRTANIVVGSAALASVALLQWRAWGQILAIVALSLSLAVSLPYAIVRLVLVSEGRGATAAASILLWIVNVAVLVFWCRPSIRRYLT